MAKNVICNDDFNSFLFWKIMSLSHFDVDRIGVLWDEVVYYVEEIST